MRVYVRTLTGRTHILEARPADLVADVKRQIAEREGKTEMRIIFAGRALDPARTLEYYGVGRDNTLHAVWKLESSCLDLEIDAGNGTLLKVHVHSKDLTVAAVKDEVERADGRFPAATQRLFFEGTEMQEDSWEAKSYGVKSGSVLELRTTTE